MLNEITFFKTKCSAIPMSRIKRIFNQFGLTISVVDEYTGFFSKPPFDIRFSPTKYKNMLGTRLTYKKGNVVKEDSIYFEEDDLLEFLYRHANELREGDKVMESKNCETLLRLLDE